MSETKPCQDCGMDLPLAVIDAGAFLYGGTRLSVDRLGELIEQTLKNRARRDAYRAGLPLPQLTDSEIGEEAIRDLVDVDPEALTAAVKHWGDMGNLDGSECERANWARWCHATGPGKDSRDMAEWAASYCNLEANHDAPCSFARQPAEATP
jgi:hypothetical protein